MDQFEFTIIPVIPDTKAPALDKGFTYSDFEYGSQLYRDGCEIGHVCTEKSRLVCIDVDDVGAYVETELFLALGRGGDNYTYSSAANDRKAHIYISVPECVSRPAQWATSEWPYDVKSNGFVRAEPAYVRTGAIFCPSEGAWAEICKAIIKDQAVYRQMYRATAQGMPTGVSSTWWPGMPEESLTSDNELSASVMAMARAGLDREESLAEWLRVSKSLTTPWSERDFNRHYSAAVEAAYLESKEKSDGMAEAQEYTVAFLDAARARRAEEAERLSSLLSVPEAIMSDDEVASMLNLPATFWEAHPVLTYIRDLAWSRVTPADAVFYALIARLAAAHPYDVRLDTGIASPASLNVLVALCAPSGGGKSSSNALAGGLVSGGAPEYPFGSGEGIAESYMGLEEIPDPAGKTNKDGSPKMVKVRMQVRRNAYFYADEGQGFTEIMSRAGSTLGSTVRSAWSGSVIGQSNGRADTTRRVEGYGMGAVIGFQPGAIAPLLDETALGTAQRFVYALATDASIPDYHPAPSPWVIPVGRNPLARKIDMSDEQDGSEVHEAIPQGGQLEVAPDIAAEIKMAHLAKARGQAVAAGDEHRNLQRAKLAALLMVLFQEGTVVQRRHWDLAGIMMDTSDKVRLHMRGLADGIRIEQQRRLGEEMGQREAAKVATVGYAAQTEAKIIRLASEGTTVRDITHRLTKKERKLYPNAAAIAEVIERHAA